MFICRQISIEKPEASNLVSCQSIVEMLESQTQIGEIFRSPLTFYHILQSEFNQLYSPSFHQIFKCLFHSDLFLILCHYNIHLKYLSIPYLIVYILLLNICKILIVLIHSNLAGVFIHPRYLSDLIVRVRNRARNCYLFFKRRSKDEFAHKSEIIRVKNEPRLPEISIILLQSLHEF